MDDEIEASRALYLKLSKVSADTGMRAAGVSLAAMTLVLSCAEQSVSLRGTLLEGLKDLMEEIRKLGLDEIDTTVESSKCSVN